MTIPQLPDLNHPLRGSASRIVPESYLSDRSGVTVWWSNVKRDGEWLLPRLFRVFTCMGNVELDLCTAQLGAGTSEIEVMCIFGSIEIRVPPDIRVLCDGEALPGNFEVERIGTADPAGPDAPTLLVTGNAYFGSVSVKIMGKVPQGWKDKLIAKLQN